MPQIFRRSIVALLTMGGSLALTMCGGGGGSTMGTSSSGGGATATSSSAGGNGGSGGESSSTSTSSSGGSCNGCTPAWICTPWDTGSGTASAASNPAQRTCTDKNNCGCTTGVPAASAMLPALDVNYFECKVEPILDRKCGMLGCHGTETGRPLRVYSRSRLREATGTITSATCAGSQTGASCTGADSCPCNGNLTALEVQRTYDATRGFALDASGNAFADEGQSDMLQQPVIGGKSHAGIHLFANGDAEYTTILNWLNGSTLATCP